MWFSLKISSFASVLGSFSFFGNRSNRSNQRTKRPKGIISQSSE